MSITIPTTQQLVDDFLAYVEARLNQDTPASDRAFTAVLAVAHAMSATGQYKYIADRIRANLAIYATGTDLDAIGDEYDTPRNQAIAAVLTLAQAGTNGTVIPAGSVYVSQSTGLLYTTQAAVTIAAGTSAPVVTCQTPGDSGNMSASDTLVLQSQIAGITAAASVVSTTTTGTDAEADDAYRQRILDVIRSVGGGGNAADYRNWAQTVEGVTRAYPYAGLPFSGLILADNEYAAQWIKVIGSPSGGTFTLTFNGGVTSALAYNASASAIQTALQALTGASAVSVAVLGSGFLVTGFTVYAPIALGTNSLSGGTNPTVYVYPNAPPMRTVYVECDTSIDPNGVAPAGLLAQVLAAITYNEAGLANQPLGLTSDTLFVRAITRTGFYVTITGLSPGSGTSATVQAAIIAALTTYFANLTPYVDGVDPTFGRNDLITQPSVTAAVQNVLDAYGATVSSVGFGLTSSSYLSTYQLGMGERAKLLGASWL